ncbi:DUF5130 family protein [Nocardioides sp. Bht2]|uniref:DUF5130 family protein n=1 Tax=Nocardioides sp. Bht2 TaxID=3392297 RepID=UPI0039B64A73
MASGEYFSTADRLAIHKTIHQAELASRFEFSVFVGQTEGADARAFATQLHNRLVAPARSIMIALDPEARTIEIVTGGEVRREVADAEVDLVVLEMRSAFAAGDLAGGLRRGITMLAEHRSPA